MVSLAVTDSSGDVRRQITDQEAAAEVTYSFESSGYEGGRYTVALRGSDWATAAAWNPDVCPNHVFLTTLGGDGDRPTVTAEASCDVAKQ